MILITFRYHTGLPLRHLTWSALWDVNPYLRGGWDAFGQPSEQWSRHSMTRTTDPAGCVAFDGQVEFPDDAVGTSFQWGVAFEGSDGEMWGIATEDKLFEQDLRHRHFTLTSDISEVSYHLIHSRWLGANRWRLVDGSSGIRFAVWAPNARAVEVVFGYLYDGADPKRDPVLEPIELKRLCGGYITNESTGIHPDWPALAMTRGANDIWSWTSDSNVQKLPFSYPGHGLYMFRITRDDGEPALRTDLYSRCQIGYGDTDPSVAAWDGSVAMLDGIKSCSVIIDPDRVMRYLREEAPWLIEQPPRPRVWPELHFVDEADFWADEFSDRPVPRRIEDLIIYELHVGALGWHRPGPGTLEDAIALIDHIQLLGFTAVELLPLAEFQGSTKYWGYSPSHHFAIEYSGGGRDQYKHFIRACHQRGIAVIVDVVYNHFAHDAERASWKYDTTHEQNNIYYWYEGLESDYENPTHGYVNNESSAFAPRYHEELVRQLFISSAAVLVTEFHVDGLRVDQTTSIHAYNKLNRKPYPPVPDANRYGAQLLRELGRTLRMIRPDVVLMAEDHSSWDEVTRAVEAGGMGFDARWHAEFYHQLVGDTDRGQDCAKLIWSAALTMGGGPLAMRKFAHELEVTGDRRVVFVESHDEAGNSKGPFPDPQPSEKDKTSTSHRLMVVACNGAALDDSTRIHAEARARFGWGMAVLSAGTPLALFGSEVGACQRFKYDTVLLLREDLHALARGPGRALARFYAELNALRSRSDACRSRNIEIVYIHDDNRILAFRRWSSDEELLVIACLADTPYNKGYVLRSPLIPSASWVEIFNSDTFTYGGRNVGNPETACLSMDGNLDVILPAAGFVVFKRTK